MKAHISNKAQQLVAYVGDYFHGTLEPTMDWDAIADAADFSSKAGFVQSIAIWHAKHAMEYESENQAACELFFACSRDLLLYSDEDHSWLQTLSTMSYSWLQSGSQDMTEEQALEIGALVLDKLRRATAEGDPSVRYKLEMLVLKSPNLFAYCKDDLLAGRFDNDGTMVFVHDGMEASYFRHAPDLFPKESFQRKDLYAKMFGKSEFMPLHPHQIANVLAGPHATPLAWLHPLQASMQNNDARSLARSWTLATKALSQLNYDPSDEASWTLWAMLHTEQKHASALGPLQQELQQQHPQMHEAFVQYWPVVTALYEEREAPQQGKDLWVQAILQRQQPGVEIDLHGLVNPTP